MIFLNDIYYLKIAKIGKTHGLNGSLQVLPLIFDIEVLVFNKIKEFLIYNSKDFSFFHHHLLSYKLNSNRFILNFKEIFSLEHAKSFINKELYIKRYDIEIDVIAEDLIGFDVMKDNLIYGKVNGYVNYGLTMIEILNKNDEVELFEFSDKVFLFEKNNKKIIIKT